MASKKSKQVDQTLVSKAEFMRGTGVEAISRIAYGFEASFNVAYAALAGIKALKRLRNSAKRAHRSTIGYVLDVFMAR